MKLTFNPVIKKFLLLLNKKTVRQNWTTSTNAYAQSQYPNATIVDNASSTYNCHGYAWHSSNGGTRYWINTPGDDTYWNDGSYVQLSSPAPAPLATKVSYSSDDHSAITTTTSNIFISKWGQWPLMQHASTYTPYNSSNLKYYSIPINGSDVVCSSTGTSFQSITPTSGSTTYSWTTGSYLTPSSQSGTTNNFSVSATGIGPSYINVQITPSCSNTTVSGRRSIWVGLPSPVTNISIYQQICGTYLEWWLDPVQWTEYATYNWTFADHGNPTPFWSTQSVAAPAYVSLYATPYSAWDITVTPQNACGNGSTYSTTWVNPCPGGGGDDTYFVYPNPSNEEIIITSGQFEVQNSDMKYRVTIVNEQNSIMYQGDLLGGVSS
jgi:hypothetical protein